MAPITVTTIQKMPDHLSLDCPSLGSTVVWLNSSSPQILQKIQQKKRFVNVNHLHFKNKNILNNYMITSLDTYQYWTSCRGIA